MRTALFESPYIRLELDADARVVWFRRTALPHPTLEGAVLMFTQAERATAHLDRARLGLLVDLRDALGRNEPEFERAITAPRAAFLSRFARCAGVVRTVAGKLQEQRLSRESASEMPVFQSETDALAHLAARGDQRR